ncbi:MAG: autotransporter-associated beta strand repeat-containing protein, partial [Gammaproteobacteria bacterium]
NSDITNNSHLIFNRSNNLTHDEVISGTGDVTQAGLGVATFTADNTYTGGTIISSGTLRIGDGATGSIVGDILNNAALIVRRTGTITLDGTISGTGSLTKQLGGVLILTADNTYTGGTTISGGDLQLGNGGTTGSIVGDVTDNAELIFNHSNAISFNGIISGSGQVTQNGSNVLSLTGTNTYTGQTNFNSGTIAVSSNDNLGAATGDLVFNGGILRFDSSFDLSAGRSITLNAGGGTFNTNGNDTTTTHAIAGSGALTKTGDGVLTLNLANSYSGGTNLNGGVIALSNDNRLGNTSGGLTFNGGTLRFNSSFNLSATRAITLNAGGGIFDTNTFDTEVSQGLTGAGGLTKINGGTLTFTGANTYTGGTTITGGVLQVGNGGTSGSLVGNILNNAILNFDRSDSYLFNGAISGTGSLSQIGAGTLILAGNNTYTGGTTIATGTLQIGNGGATGSIVGNILDNSALIFDRSGVLIFNDIISGTGTVTKNGSGTVILNGVNTYTGDTDINAGTLLVGDAFHPGASIAGNVNVNPGGTLGGYGFIAGDVLNNGTVSPGASIDTMNIGGNYTQTAAGNLLIEVAPNGSSDVLNIAGIATLAGTLTVDLSNGFQVAQPYVFLTAGGGVVGQFDNLILQGAQNTPFIQDQLIYLPNSVIFTANFNPVAFTQAAATQNQKNVANYILMTGGTTAIEKLIMSLSNYQQFRDAMDQISGATYANQTLELSRIANWYQDQISDRIDHFPSCVDIEDVKTLNNHKPYESCKNGKTVWLRVYGANDKIFSGDVSGLNTNDTGFVLGGEVPVTDHLGVGAAFGFDSFHSDATSREIASDNGDLFQLGVYTYYQRDKWLLGAAADLGTTNQVNAQRQIQSVNGLVQTNTNYIARLAAEQFRASYDMGIKHRVDIRPFAALLLQQIDRGSLNEQGGTGFELNLNDSFYHSVRSQLGVILEVPNDFKFRPFVSVAWEHEFADTNAAFDASFPGFAPGFNIVSTNIGENTAVVKAGVVVAHNKHWDVSALYEGRFATNVRQNAAMLQGRYWFN